MKMELVPEKVRLLLGQLDFCDEEMVIYMILMQRGVLTALEVSRFSGISRTQVYRFLERMKEKGVVEEVVDEHRLMTRAVGLEQLEKLFRDRKAQIEEVDKLFPQIKETLLGTMSLKHPDTQVKFYRGEGGIQRMAWNVLSAEKEIVGFTYRSFKSAVGEKFKKEFYEELVIKGLKMKDIYSDQYVKSLQNPVKEIGNWDGYTPGIIKLVSSRYISPLVLDINCQSDIYNDVVSYYNWFEREVFGVEIYNRKVAKLQRQLFEMVWEKAITEDELKEWLKKQK